MAERSERGFTLIELLVVMGILSVVLTAFYQVLFSATDGSNTAENIARVSEEARLGFNRMVRDTREADRIVNPSANSFKVEIDFNADGSIQPTPLPDELGSYETLTFTFNPGPGTITVTNGLVTEILMAGVSCVVKSGGGCEDVFTFASSRLEYDTDGNGVTSALELDQAPGIGNNVPSVWTLTESGAIDRVSFALGVTKGSSTTQFHADAQLRNKR